MIQINYSNKTLNSFLNLFFYIQFCSGVRFNLSFQMWTIKGMQLSRTINNKITMILSE